MLEWSTAFFKKKSVPGPRLSIEWLLSDVLGIKRLDLYLNYDRPLSQDELDRLRPLVKRRSEHEPLQYILGSTDFLQCEIAVDRRVLIPRPETEQLVEILLHSTLPEKESPFSLLDIGTGSGCIPISISKERPSWKCSGLDVSEQALELARENAIRNETDVTFFQQNLFDLTGAGDLPEKDYDLIISNPPYIEPDEKDSLEPQVVQFEPEQALFEKDPIRLYTHLIRIAFTALRPGGKLFLECNPRHTKQIHKIAGMSFSTARIHPDYSQKERFVEALKKS